MSESMDCMVRIQGGPVVPGTAIGRMGNKTLVRYQTVSSGDDRERWFEKDRVFELVERKVVGDIVTYSHRPDRFLTEAYGWGNLPRYRKPRCKGWKLEKPVSWSCYCQNRKLHLCKRCGKLHPEDTEGSYRDDTLKVVGFKPKSLEARKA